METKMSDNFKAKLYDAETLDDYIKIYERKFSISIDMTPEQIRRKTEKRMIQELKKLNLIIKGD